jgi:hypothetical protein
LFRLLMVISISLSFLLSKGEHSAYLRFNAPHCKIHAGDGDGRAA